MGKLDGKVVLITGAASGIGRALAERFHAEGAAHVVVADLDAAGAREVAARIGGTGVHLDVSDESALVRGYRRFLIQATASRAMEWLETAPNYCFPKSLILYAEKRAPAGRAH